MRRLLLLVLLAVGISLVPAAVSAQTAEPPSLRVTVSDSTGGVIVGARVAVRQAGGPGREVTTGELGVAVVGGLVPGSADVTVESPGFESRTVTGRRIRSGVNRLEVRLQIGRLEMSVDVSRDLREKQLDPRGDAFVRVLTPEMIAQLPDDPDELENVLRQMAGPGATIRINGFGGARLPAKGQIRQIRFSLNSFSAEMHELGMPMIDIVTQPGLDRWRTALNAGFRNEALTARYAYAPTSASEQVQRGSLTIDGPLWRNHTSLSFSVDTVSLADSQTFLASTPGGQVSGIANRPTDRTNFSVLVEHALTNAHTSRVELTRNGTGLDNLGVGGASLPERAYSTTQTNHTLRLSDSGPLGKRLYNEVRVQVAWNDHRAHSVTSERAVVVLDAFSAGGAQVDNARRSWEIELADNVDFARGRHAFRSGVLFQGGRYRATDAGNRLGTFTFSGLDGYLAGRPTTFMQRVGDPRVAYSFYRAGWYLQDDIKAHKSLTVSLGLRHETQSHIDGRFNLAPRAGFTWAPLPNGKLVVRGGAGVVYTWFDSSLYEQTLRVDGQRQYDIVVSNPGFPDPFAGTEPLVLPPSRLVAAPGLRLPRIVNTSLAIQRQFTLTSMLMVTYTHQAGTGLFRGHNLNAPLSGGGRPFPSAGNITQIESAGRSRLDRLDIVGSRLAIKNGKARYILSAYYSLSRQRNDTDGPFSVPSDPTNPAADWGAASSDVRHRVSGMASVMLPRGFRVMTMTALSSAPPYNITTGFDDNHDTAINDRPAGVGRNSGRGAGQFDVTARVGYTIGFGKAPGPATAPPNIRRLTSDAQRDPLGAIGSAMGVQAHRYRLELFVQTYNVLNRVNRIGFRGVMTSPFYGQPTAAMPPRRIEVGTRFDF
jgi:hypothetical protein